MLLGLLKCVSFFINHIWNSVSTFICKPSLLSDKQSFQLCVWLTPFRLFLLLHLECLLVSLSSPGSGLYIIFFPHNFYFCIILSVLRDIFSHCTLSSQPRISIGSSDCCLLSLCLFLRVRWDRHPSNTFYLQIKMWIKQMLFKLWEALFLECAVMCVWQGARVGGCGYNTHIQRFLLMCGIYEKLD